MRKNSELWDKKTQLLYLLLFFIEMSLNGERMRFYCFSVFSRGKRLHVLQEFLKLSEMKSQKSQDKLIISHQMIWAALPLNLYLHTHCMSISHLVLFLLINFWKYQLWNLSILSSERATPEQWNVHKLNWNALLKWIDSSWNPLGVYNGEGNERRTPARVFDW